MVELNVKTFWSRMGALLERWANPVANVDWVVLDDMDAILLLSGDPAGEEEAVKKSTAFQTWLLGYEFPSTILLIQKEAVTFVASASKAQILNQLQDGAPVSLKILTLAKAKEPPSNALPDLLEQLSSSKRVAIPQKEKHSGRLATDWSALTSAPENAGKFDWVEAAPVLSLAMATKDEEELRSVRTAAHIASAIMIHSFVPKLEGILDKQNKIPHSSFAAYLEERIGNPEASKGPDMRVFNKSRHLNDVDWSLVEIPYSPVIQSKGTKTGYDLKPSAQSGEDTMAVTGVILSSIGIKYKGYSAQLGRSFLVDPSKEQDGNYTFLLALQHEVLSKMHDGAKTEDVYTAAVDYIKSKKPELEKHFPKSIGFAMGLEFRDSQWIINSKNTRILRSDMIFSLALGFQDLEDSKGKKYALSLIDTIKVSSNASVCLTEGGKDSKDFIFRFEDDEKPAAKTNGKPKSAGKSEPKVSNSVVVGSKVLRGKTRQQLLDPDASKTVSAKIAEHQKELFAQRQEEGIAKYAGEDAGADEDRGKAWKRFQAYKGEMGLPKEVESLRIYVDRRNQSVVLPINGFAVPFHINTLKNAVSSEVGDYMQLRINFLDVGSGGGRKDEASFEDPNAIFIRSLSYRSMDGHRVDTLVKQITELKKEANKREQEKKEMADVVEQDVLVEMKGRRPHKLPDVFARPALDGKRLPGELEVHANGVRYQSPLGQKIGMFFDLGNNLNCAHHTLLLDLPFSNIKHLFFQPCDGEMLVIIHFHLRSPIIIGKKKTKVGPVISCTIFLLWTICVGQDVQIYREASDVQFDETGNRKRKYRYGDEDEIELEQTEMKRRRALNKEFKHFADKIAEGSDNRVEVDIPFRDLAFEGVPVRASVKMQPTTDCLIHLSDPPFTVVTLAEIEIASLERVQFSLKQFDMVLIFKDFSKPPLHINSIPSTQLDNVKEWLDSVDVPLAEGPVNLNWSQIMKTINDSPFEFFKERGWSFLVQGDNDSNASSDESSQESEFEADPEEFAASSTDESDAYSDDDASNASDDEDFDDDDGSGDESGQDWDALEEKAAASDKKKREAARARGSDDDSEDDDRPKKKANGKSKR
ncbi:FACT complex subunit SPT16 [Clavulina sp. PMI_390]|nr:FACT complex subunit SPT16 [Clavulina sp. PMI_390]